MKTLKPIIQTEEPDKYGRTVKVGITDGTTASFFQVMSMGEVRNLRDELTKFLNHSGVGTPVFDFKSFEGMRDRVNATIFVPSNNLNHLVMGHKRVFNIITSQCINGQWGIADIAFSITSKEKALWQMDTINRLTQRGEWFVGSEWHYEIQKDELNPVDGQPRFVRDIMIKCVETGTLVLYRMIESPLNSMYISK